MFCKNVIKKPYMFQSLLYDHPQGLSFVLSASPLLRKRRSGNTLSVVSVVCCQVEVSASG
jgi:hypothetical protein